MIVSIPVWLTMFFSDCQNWNTSGHDISLGWMFPPEFVRHCILMCWFPKGDIITRGVIIFMLTETLSIFFSTNLLFHFLPPIPLPIPFLSQCISFKNNILGNYWPLLPPVETISDSFWLWSTKKQILQSSTFQLINPFLSRFFFAIPFFF